jgi:DNA-directed RNA polymerase specialized sigma24 family protein
LSPASLRRVRAERLLREDFARLRGTVISRASRRLCSRGVHVDRSDLEGFYAQAWHGLYTAVLEGVEVANPAGWLALVTFRRAVEEQRSGDLARRVERSSAHRAAEGGRRRTRASVDDADFAEALDDRMRLRQLMEGLSARLTARELEAASLCYLHGLSRAEASQRMGVSESRLRKLMDGHRGRRGVAHKVGALVGTIAAGEWCAEQGSLMRGFAYGILDPAGERYRIALAHQSNCPACRSYVLSLRGLAVALPPAPWLLPAALGAGASSGSAVTAGASAGAASAGGAANGGWLLAGAGMKVTAGCALALGVGAGCVALNAHEQDGGRGRMPARLHPVVAPSSAQAHALARAAGGRDAAPLRAGATMTTAARARREFGLELAGNGRPALRSRARSASVASAPAPAPSREPVDSGAAAREFSPG